MFDIGLFKAHTTHIKFLTGKRNKKNLKIKMDGGYKKMNE